MINEQNNNAGLTPDDNSENNITPLETTMLDNAGAGEEDESIDDASLDNTDEDGDMLNENTTGDTESGDELDVPGSEEDDENEAIGEEDEENNSYSLGGERNSE